MAHTSEFLASARNDAPVAVLPLELAIAVGLVLWVLIGLALRGLGIGL